MRAIRQTAARHLATRPIISPSTTPLLLLPTSTRPCLYATPAPQNHRAQSSTPHNKETPFSATPPESQTHYTFFRTSIPSGPPPAGPFGVDLAALKREFLQLQARAHPDLHRAGDKKKAEALSARINEAYKTLQSPLHRAQYLLSLRGVEVAEDETAKVDDAELLMEVLETREAVEEAGEEADLVGLREENEGRIERSVEGLEEAFARDDVEGAKREVVRLRYWVNIAESIGNWEKGKPVVLEH